MAENEKICIKLYLFITFAIFNTIILLPHLQSETILG